MEVQSAKRMKTTAGASSSQAELVGSLESTIPICVRVWQTLKETPLGSPVGSMVVMAFIDYCAVLKGQSYETHWKAYNLMLTAVAADFFGLGPDVLPSLRKLNFQMPFQQIVRISPEDYTGVPGIEEQLIRRGLAIQAWLDFDDKTARLGDVSLEDLIVVAQGLVQEGHPPYTREWLRFINKASEGGDPCERNRGSEGANLDSFKVKDCSDQVLPALQVVLRLCQDSEMKDEACSAWFRILSPMPFVGIVKSLRGLLRVSDCPRQLMFLLNTGRSFIINRLGTHDDGAAVTELKGLLDDLYKSSKIYVEQKETETTLDRLDVVQNACRLYTLIVMRLARGPSKYHQLVVAPNELKTARDWLLGLQAQLSTARMDDSFTRHAYHCAASVLKVALILNDAPFEYRGGVPL